MLDLKICRQARLSRDARFDGKFFIGVTSTSIFCRTVCPARLPLEKNVQYFASAADALRAGFRPCLRCNPDALPHSYEWSGKDYLLNKIVRLLESGQLEDKKLYQICRDFNITRRYLHKIFVARFGLSPKKYQLYYKCSLAKQLIRQTGLAIGDIAYACGFSSISLFNATFKRHFQLTPTELRRNKRLSDKKITLKIPYLAPYDWARFLDFLSKRQVNGLENVENGVYSRNILCNGIKGRFSIAQCTDESCFTVEIFLENWQVLSPVLANIRRLLDIDADLAKIEAVIKQHAPNLTLRPGLRIPGVWDTFEAGVRAICGQQVSVAAATKMVEEIVRLSATRSENDALFFPTPEQLAELDFSLLKTTGRRKETLKRFAEFCCSNDANNPDDWLAVKGIGEWTINYARLRGLGDPDVWLASDLGIKKALAACGSQINSEECRPWRSYLGLQLWSNLNV